MTMKLKIEIDTGNAAFTDPCSEMHDDDARRTECARILRRVADKLVDGFESGNLKDINGNHVGQFKFEE